MVGVKDKMYSWQDKVLAIVPKFTGSISFIFSLYIVQHVARSSKRQKRIYHRLLLGMSSHDMIGSFFSFILSTTPMPVGTAFGAVGTLQTCTVAAFFGQAANVSALLYHASLATFYLLMIVHGWKQTRLNKIEWILHAVPILVGWSLATAGLALKIYAPANWTCWIGPYPSDCKDSRNYGSVEANCIRGNNYFIYRFAFSYALIWSTVAYMIVTMGFIYHTVLQNERANEKYHHRGLARSRSKSRRIANQALFYVGAMILTYMFGTLTRVLQKTQGKTYFPMIFLMAIFLPLQGFFNCLTYLRPRYLSYRAAIIKRADIPPWHVAKVVTCSCCGSTDISIDANEDDEFQDDDQSPTMSRRRPQAPSKYVFSDKNLFCSSLLKSRLSIKRFCESPRHTSLNSSFPRHISNEYLTKLENANGSPTSAPNANTSPSNEALTRDLSKI